MTSTEEYVQDATFASLPRTVRGMPLALNASPDGQKLIYCNGNSVYIRNIQNPKECEIYTEHANPTTVAKYSPSGFYIASGDQSGKIRIWDATQSSHILKAEYPVLSGPVRDIAWSEDSKRIAVVGEGRERFGHVFLFDTGTSNGNLSGQSRTMSSIDFRPVRPYRLVSGSEDNTVALFEGPPFKFLTLFHEHTRFVYCVRYNASGTLFASAGADGKVILYEGTSGQKEGELVDDQCKGMAHSGSVFALCWSPDGQHIATASGDKTVKIWDVASKKLEKTFVIGKAVDDQQLCIIWTKFFLAGVSLSGFINILDLENGSVSKVLKGHNKPITAFAVCPEKSLAFTADFEGNITQWFLDSGDSERLMPTIHSSQVKDLEISGIHSLAFYIAILLKVSDMCISLNGDLVSVGWDDSIAFTSFPDSSNHVQSDKVKLSSQPRQLALGSGGKIAVVACQKSVTLFSDCKQMTSENIDYEASCVAVTPDSRLIAVGSQEGKVHIYELNGNHIEEKKTISQTGSITSLSWSPNGNYLVATDANRKVIPYSVDNDYNCATEKDWTFHTARVNCSAWSADSRFVATGGIDTNVIIWDLKHSGEHPIIIRGAHTMSPINGIAWLGPNQIITAGQDSVLKVWTVKIRNDTLQMTHLHYADERLKKRWVTELFVIFTTWERWEKMTIETSKISVQQKMNERIRCKRADHIQQAFLPRKPHLEGMEDKRVMQRSGEGSGEGDLFTPENPWQTSILQQDGNDNDVQEFTNTYPLKGGCGVDLLFLLDTSGSLEQIYTQHINWTTQLAETLLTNEDQVHIAVIQYAETPTVEFSLGTYRDKIDIINHIMTINFQSGGTRTGKALLAAKAVLLNEEKGARKNASKIIVLFTDGLSTDDPIKHAQQLREIEKVKIYIVYVGSDGFESEMDRIAGGKSNIFGPEEFSRLQKTLMVEVEHAQSCGSQKDWEIPTATIKAMTKMTAWTESSSKVTTSAKLHITTRTRTSAVSHPTSRKSLTNDTPLKHNKKTFAKTAAVSQDQGVKFSEDEENKINAKSIDEIPLSTVNDDVQVTEATTVLQESTFSKDLVKNSEGSKSDLTSGKFTKKLQKGHSRTGLITPLTNHSVAESRGISRPPNDLSSNKTTLVSRYPTVQRLSSPVPKKSGKTKATGGIEKSQGQCPREILFIVDSSGSVQRIYDQQKEYLLSLLNELQISEGDQRVALIQFAGSSHQRVEWTFDTYKDAKDVAEALAQVRHFTGTTYIGRALENSIDVLETRRQGIPTTVILVSDGFSQDDASKPAEEIRRMPNVDFYAVSMSELSNFDYLVKLTEDPSKVYVGARSEDLKQDLLSLIHCRT
uniref:Actin-interacting protein 1 n=1 Tax=Setaria digitata TaxID=48799 RepID=A0A915PZ21_9BILA